MILRPLLVTMLMALAGPAAAQDILQRADQKLHYEDCLRLAASNPAAALGYAVKWAGSQGGVPAQHCQAVALVSLKRYGEGAAKLDALGRAPDMGALRASLFDQAGNAWLLAHDAPHAVASFQAALALSGNDPDLYADLARAQALTKDWRQVEAEMNAALAIMPKRPDLLVLRASARHALGNKSGARNDIAAALSLKANYPEALVERAELDREAGDALGARSDYQNALKAGAGGQTADAARRGLAALDQAKAAPVAAAPVKPAAKARPATPPKR